MVVVHVITSVLNILEFNKPMHESLNYNIRCSAKQEQRTKITTYLVQFFTPRKR